MGFFEKFNIFSKNQFSEQETAEKKLFDDLKNLYDDVVDEINTIPKMQRNIQNIKQKLIFENVNNRNTHITTDTNKLSGLKKTLLPFLNFEHKLDDRFKKIDFIQEEVIEKLGTDTNTYNEKLHEMVNHIVIDYRKDNSLGTPYQQKMMREEIDKLHKEVEQTKTELIPLVDQLTTYQKKQLEQNVNEIIDFEKKLTSKLNEIFKITESKRKSKVIFFTDDELSKIKSISEDCVKLCDLVEAYLNGEFGTLNMYVKKVLDFEKRLKELKDISDAKITESEILKQRLARNREMLVKRGA